MSTPVNVPCIRQTQTWQESKRTSNSTMNDGSILQLHGDGLIVKFHQKPGEQMQIAV